MATNKDFIVKNGLSVGEDISVSGSVTSNLQFDDNVQIQLGTDSDLLIHHDGTDNYIDAPVSGHLYIQNQVAGKDIKLRADNGSGSLEDYIVIDSSTRKVKIKYAGANVIETKSSGIDVTGNVGITGALTGPASFTIDPAAVGDNTGTVIIAGNLQVDGTTTTINSTTLNVDDLNITLANGAASTAAADGAGITIDGAGAIFAWNDTQGSMTLNKELRLDNNKGLFFHNAAGNATLGIKADTNDQITFRQNGNWDRLVIKNTGVDVSGVLTASGNIVTTANVSAGTYTGITLGGSLSGDYTDAKVQYGTTFSGTPAQGHFFFDSLNQKLKVYTGSAFVDAVPAGGGGGGGSGSSDATATFRKYTYTLTGTTNAISGKEDDEVTTGDFISGRLYEITAVGDTDFTAIGASSNAIGVQFTATDVGGGTTGKAKEVLFYATGGTQNTEVYVNGVKAVEGSSNDYVATTGTSVTFTSNLSSGDVVDIQVYELLTQDSFYLKSETYTQAQTIAGFVAKSGDTMTGNLNVGSSGANALFTAYGGATARPTFVHASGYGGLQLAGTGAGSGSSLIFSNNHTNGLIEEWSIFHDGATDDLVFISGDPADVATLEKMRLTEDGKLGIGTSPDTALHVDPGYVTLGTSSGTDNSWINNVEDGNLELVNEGRSTDSGSVRINRKNNPAGDTTYFRDTVIYDGKSHAIVFVDGSEDKVGIGTDSPYTDLDVAGEIAMSIGNAHAVFSTDASGKIYIKANENKVNATTAIHMQMPIITGSGALEDKLVINHTDITAYEHVLPISNATLDLGSSTLAWRNVYTNDLHLSNEGHEEGNSVDGTKGNWTIQEGEEHLYIINNKSGKKYKFALEEIE